MAKRKRKLGIDNLLIHRVYKCENPECLCEIAVEEKACGGSFKVDCPFCKNPTLILDHAALPFSIVMGLKECRTIGAQSDKNRDFLRKNFGYTKKPKAPWWRKDKQNFKILKDPKSYIETGTY